VARVVPVLRQCVATAKRILGSHTLDQRDNLSGKRWTPNVFRFHRSESGKAATVPVDHGRLVARSRGRRPSATTCVKAPPRMRGQRDAVGRGVARRGIATCYDETKNVAVGSGPFGQFRADFCRGCTDARFANDFPCSRRGRAVCSLASFRQRIRHRRNAPQWAKRKNSIRSWLRITTRRIAFSTSCARGGT
jgi:hypothetical protein